MLYSIQYGGISDLVVSSQSKIRKNLKKYNRNNFTPWRYDRWP